MQFDFSVGSSPANSKANRYRNILPTEQTRVRMLDPPEYINANEMRFAIGDGNALRVIMSQAPLEGTSALFWSMIYEFKCPCIVMLTVEVCWVFGS